MRKVIVEAEVSLDGVMGGDMAEFWQQLMAFHSPDVQQYLEDLLFLPDALLLGRVTFESFAMIWPERQGKDADQINAMPKYVASRTLKEPLPWNGRLLQGDTATAIRKLKQEGDGSLLQYGIGELTQTMLQHGLVDELRILQFPFTFGEGPRIFDKMGVNTLQLAETRTFDSGAFALHYVPTRNA